jgi:hypothetical protein
VVYQPLLSYGFSDLAANLQYATSEDYFPCICSEQFSQAQGGGGRVSLCCFVFKAVFERKKGAERRIHFKLREKLKANLEGV